MRRLVAYNLASRWPRDRSESVSLNSVSFQDEKEHTDDSLSRRKLASLLCDTHGCGGRIVLCAVCSTGAKRFSFV